MSGQNTASAPYTDTYIVECNRSSSMEANGGNNDDPSIFTNKQGQGIKLDAGDKVQIHSAFINEIGNTDGTIEIKGTDVKDSKGNQIKYTLTETQDTLSIPYPLSDVKDMASCAPWTGTAKTLAQERAVNAASKLLGSSTPVQLCQPYGHQRCDCQNVEREFVMKDNEMNFQMSYYKTTNGENYMHLPRIFDFPTGVTQAHTAMPGDNFGISHAQSVGDESGMPFCWQGQADVSTASVSKSTKLFFGQGDCPELGQTRFHPRAESRVNDEWKFGKYGQGGETTPAYSKINAAATATNLNWGSAKNRADNDTPAQQNPRDDRIWQRSNTNVKYMIFKKEKTFFNPPRDYGGATKVDFFTEKQRGECIDGDAKLADTTNSQYTLDFFSCANTATIATATGHPLRPSHPQTNLQENIWRRDPALTGQWFPYKEIKNIKIETGFHSPEDISEQISQQLNKTTATEDIYGVIGTQTLDGSTPKNVTANTKIHHKVGIKKDGECFKNFYSTNHHMFSKINAIKYFQDSIKVESILDNDGTTPECLGSVVDYMSAYHYIGVRRPSFFIKGREFAIDYSTASPYAPNYEVITQVPWADRSEGELQTDIPWTERHKLNAFVEAQAEYPELFDYHYTNIATAGDFQANVDKHKTPMCDKDTGITYARFVHMDPIIKTSWQGADGTGSAQYHFPPAGFQTTIDNEDRTFFGPESKGNFSIGSDNYDGHPDADLWRNRTFSVVNDAGAAVTLNPPVVGGDGTSAATQGSYDNTGFDKSSVPFWFYYDQSRVGLDDGGDIGCSDDALCYGFMKKWLHTGEGGKECISFTTKKIGGIPDFLYKRDGNPYADPSSTDASAGPTGQDLQLLSKRLIGYDLHFNAYGNACIMPYAGLSNCEGNNLTALSTLTNADLGAEFYYYAKVGGTTMVSAAPPVGATDVAGANSLEPIWKYCLSSLIGANSISMSYDSTQQKRFQFTNLHTPEYIGNIFNAGSGPEAPINPDSGKAVYKINKRLRGSSFCPEMTPYAIEQSEEKVDAEKTNTSYISVSQFNHNLDAWDTIYDTHSGVMFEDFGGDDDNKEFWHKSLWGLLGFTYEQLNRIQPDTATLNIKDRLSRQTFLTATNIADSEYIYTNSSVKQADISQWNSNSFGASLYTERAPSQGKVARNRLWTEVGPSVDNAPAIVIDTQSIPLKADRQPTKMLKPYFLIKSNIVGDMKYFGSGHNTEGGQLLPIVGVVNKENGFGDYYFQTDSKNVFTCTQPYTLSEITTSIHDPDMSPARVDKNSAILYMIQKQNNNNLNVIQGLMSQPATAKEMMTELSPPQMTPEEYTQYFETFILSKQREEQLMPNINTPIPDTSVQLQTDPQYISPRVNVAEGRLAMNSLWDQWNVRLDSHIDRARRNARLVSQGIVQSNVLPPGTMRNRTPTRRPGQQFTPSPAPYAPHIETEGTSSQGAPTESSVFTEPVLPQSDTPEPEPTTE